MKIDLADKGWLQNRLIDLGLLLIISILAVPIAGFSFIDEAQEVHTVLPWSAIFGFMIPELFFVGIFGIISLIHHGKTHWRYQNPIKAFFVMILGTILIFLTMHFVLLTFVPNIHDCIISFYWGTKPCSALDVEGFLSMVFYVYFIIPSLLFLLMLFIIILKPNSVIKNDWYVLKNWFYSSRSKRFRWGTICIINFLSGVLAIPILLPMVNSELTDFATLMALVLAAPLFMVVIPIISNIGMYIVLSELWLSEKDMIVRFRSLSKQAITHFILSRLFIPLTAAFLFEGVLFGVVLAYIFFYYTKLQVFPLKDLGIWLYAFGVLLFNIFSAIFLTWNIITHGNYLRFILPQNPKRRPPDVSAEFFQQIKELRRLYLDETGFLLNYCIITGVGVFYFMPLAIITLTFLVNTISESWSSIMIDFGGILFFWIWLVNIAFLLASWILWKKNPRNLQNIPKSRYKIPEQFKKIFKYPNQLE